MAIQLTATHTQMRYISEWDPREAAHTKGGYLEGEIAVPDLPGLIRMEMSTHPAADAHPLISTVHPILLHLVRIGHNGREQELEPVPNFTHWRQVFEVEGDKVFVLNQTSPLDVEKDGTPRQVPPRPCVAYLKAGRKIHLSKRKGDLNLILLLPKQRARSIDGETTVPRVLMDRLGIPDSKALLPYERMYKGKNGKNLKKMRIKVTFSAGDYKSTTVSPQTIVDTGNKDIGAMDFVDAHPRRSCCRGGRKVILLSEYNLCKDIVPVFLVYTTDPETGEEEERSDLEQLLRQPEDVEVRNTQVLFRTPAQDRLEELVEPHKLKLAVRRLADGHLSTTKFTWKFERHNEGNCIECDWKVDGI